MQASVRNDAIVSLGGVDDDPSFQSINAKAVIVLPIPGAFPKNTCPHIRGSYQGGKREREREGGRGGGRERERERERKERKKGIDKFVYVLAGNTSIVRVLNEEKQIAMGTDIA